MNDRQPDLASSPGQTDLPVALDFRDDGSPPRCWVCVTAITIALIFLPPVYGLLALRLTGSSDTMLSAAMIAAGLAGLASCLGVIGIVRTRGRRRRGRVRAVLAIFLGVVGAVMQLGTGVTGYRLYESTQTAQKAVRLLRTGRDDIDTAVTAWLPQLGSQRLQVTVTPADLQAWLEGILAEHGQLQQVTPNEKGMKVKPGGVTVVSFAGQFVNGMAGIEIDIGFDRRKARVDDIRVAGKSPL